MSVSPSGWACPHLSGEQPGLTKTLCPCRRQDGRVHVGAPRAEAADGPRERSRRQQLRGDLLEDDVQLLSHGEARV